MKRRFVGYENSTALVICSVAANRAVIKLYLGVICKNEAAVACRVVSLGGYAVKNELARGVSLQGRTVVVGGVFGKGTLVNFNVGFA